MQANQFGRTMMEMLGVLTIIGVLSVGGIAGFSEAMMQHNVSKTLEQIMSITAHLAQIGEQSGTYEGLDNSVAIKLKALSENETVNAFGGDVVVKSSGLLAAGDDSAFSVTYTGLSSAACLRLAAQNWQSSNAGSLVGVGFTANEENVNNLEDSILMDCLSSQDVDGVTIGCAKGTNTENLISLSDAVANGCNCSNDTCVMVVKYF